jgi:hypothetical protein
VFDLSDSIGLVFAAAGLQLNRYAPLALTALPFRALFALRPASLDFNASDFAGHAQSSGARS